MQYQEFIKQVRERAELDSEQQAAAAVRATLETLTEHLAGNAPAKLAAQLPAEIGEFIINHKTGENAAGEGFGVEEFVRRTAAKIGSVETQETQKQATIVLSVLRKAITTGEFDKIRGTLPAEYDALFKIDESNFLKAGS